MSNYAKIKNGDKFGRLTVIEDLGFFKKDGAKTKRHWYLCQCDCANKTIKMIEGDPLKRGTTKSCGCLSEENLEKGRKLRKYNKYYIYDDIVFVKFTNCEEYFICDLDDWEKAKSKTWYKNTYGYAVSDTNKDRCRLNRFIMNPTKEQYTDHINGYLNDYRKSNLRNVTPQENTMNIGLKPQNTSGHTGVYLNKYGKYEAYISKDKNRYYLGVYDTYEEAVEIREEAERKYFGEFRRVL